MKVFATLLLISPMLIAGVQSEAYTRQHGTATELAVPTITGQVTNDAGEPLPGVVVSVIGTPQLTSTNASGNFLMTLAGMKATLQFKCQGYRDHILTVTAGSTLAIKMYSTTKVAPPTASIAHPGTEISEATAGPQVYNFSEELPTFPGGDGAYSEYMRKNAHYPEEALAKHISGMVFVSFVVDEQGRVINAEITKGIGYGLDQEALRLIRLMPWWNPGKIGGKAVRVSRVLPVPFAYREAKAE
jgi:TonB family protein